MSSFYENQISKIQTKSLEHSKTIDSTGENLAVENCLQIINNSLLRKTDVDKIPVVLERLKSEFDTNFGSKIYAAHNRAYDVILDVLTTFDKDRRIVNSALKNMIRLTGCQSNLLNEEGIEYQMRSLKNEQNLPNVQLLLRWMRNCCIRSEKNRQDIFNARVIDVLKSMLHNRSIRGSKLVDICSVLRALALDDDPEFDYGNSVNRTQNIGNETLAELTISLEIFKHRKKVLSEILKTLITLLPVENEYCRKVENAGGLTSIIDTMRSFPDDEHLNRLILRLIRVLAGNDIAKMDLVSLGAAPLIITAMSRIQTGAIAVAGLRCVAALTSGSPRNSRIFNDREAPRLIIETMERYQGSLDVQSYGARAISNMGMKNKIDPWLFLNSDVEICLEIAMKIHGDKIEGDIKDALKNLGLNPELKDRWSKIPGKKQGTS